MISKCINITNWFDLLQANHVVGNRSVGKDTAVRSAKSEELDIVAELEPVEGMIVWVGRIVVADNSKHKQVQLEVEEDDM